MNSQNEKAGIFARLHVKGDPVILFNIWDAGTAKAVADAGAKAIATGSWSVAAANGYSDGEELPMEAAIANIGRITASVDLPVTLDFEGGYTADLSELRANVAKVITAGAVGINFEDQIVGGEGLYSIAEQRDRIAAVRAEADKHALPLFINARTDIFLKTLPGPHTREQLEAAIERAQAYADAGGSGFFAPGLRDPELIGELCHRSPLPVNIMVMADVPPNHELAELGAARISYGPGPYRRMMEALKDAAMSVFAGRNT
ncbi:MAG: isocitrate lyase/phosphoenolpyruvate mutase family protein [Acidobacteria bacterium]|nr:isocitrate lyase/phosphoenolpyruvate mutase family protein [Acidobacteriota bacterium]